MRKQLTLGLLASLLLLLCQSAYAAQQLDPSDHNEKVALRYIWFPIKGEQRGGRVYYGMSACDSVRWETPFPEVLIDHPTKDMVDVAALRRFFKKNARVRISDSNGIIRIRFGTIPALILKTKIAELDLSQEDQYNPELAISEIENAPEVKAQMKRLGISTLNLPMNLLIAPPTPGAFHLPSVMKNVSMDEALDVVATTFHGLVETAYCRKSQQMDSDITGYDRN